MNGVHDMGGMQGFGAIVREENEPYFHEAWEKRMWSLTMTVRRQGFINIDEFRHGIERMDAAHYLDSSYYEHWLVSVERILVEKGYLSQAELDARVAELAKEEA